MFEIALVVLVEFVLFFMEKFLVKKRGKKSVGLTGGSRKVFGSFVFKLIIEVFLVFQERAGMSLVVFKKALVVVGYDVEKNNRRIKLGFKSFVSKGILVQIRGIGVFGFFKLSKKVIFEFVKGRVKKGVFVNVKKLVLFKGSKFLKSVKINKRISKARILVVQLFVRGGRKFKGVKGK